MTYPKNVEFIINTLEAHGFEGYIVGGCVRDALLGRTPTDFDLCTNATPQQIEACFEGLRMRKNGLKHGTLTLIIDHTPYEVTTFRTESVYTDNRRPDSVSFVASLEQDLRRRDFTVNAMAHSHRTGVVDCFGGQEDLRCGVIRAVDDPTQRFLEDGLRIMRGLRFAATYGFEVEQQTALAMLNCRGLLKNISGERISAELAKLIVGDGAGSILAGFWEVLATILPEISSHPDPAAATRAIAAAPPCHIVRLALLLGGKGGSTAPLRRLKFDDKTIAGVGATIKHSVCSVPQNDIAVKYLLGNIGPQGFERLLQFWRALAKTEQNPQTSCAKISQLDTAQKLYARVMSAGECYNLSMLCITGEELLTLGLPQGPKIGKFLGELLELVMQGRLSNDKSELLQYAKNRAADL